MALEPSLEYRLFLAKLQSFSARCGRSCAKKLPKKHLLIPLRTTTRLCSADVLMGSQTLSLQAADVAAVDHGTAVSFQTAADGAAVSFSPPPPPPALEDVAREAEESGAGAGPGGYVGRLRTAVLDCVDTAKRAPETFEEALAVMKGERAVKPDYGRAVSTVSAVSYFKRATEPTSVLCTSVVGLHDRHIPQKHAGRTLDVGSECRAQLDVWRVILT